MPIDVATKDQLKNSRIEKIFYLTLIVTVLHGGFILWELVAMIAGIPNKVVPLPAFSNIYLLFLGTYAGYKEFVRWWEDAGVLDKEQTKERILQFQRGEIIVAIWIGLYLVCLVLLGLLVIPQLPGEIERTTLQVFVIVLGSYGSKGAYLGRLKRKIGSSGQQQSAEARMTDAECEKKIMEILRNEVSISNDRCREILGVDRFKAYDILDKLTKQGKLVKTGDGKGSAYKLP